MGLKKIAEKLEKYQKRLASGKADKIKPEHVAKAIDKLAVKEAELVKELAETTKPEKQKRVEYKVRAIREQIKQAKWLARQI